MYNIIMNIFINTNIIFDNIGPLWIFINNILLLTNYLGIKKKYKRIHKQ